MLGPSKFEKCRTRAKKIRTERPETKSEVQHIFIDRRGVSSLSNRKGGRMSYGLSSLLSCFPVDRLFVDRLLYFR